MLKPLVIFMPKEIDVKKVKDVYKNAGFYPYTCSYDTVRAARMKHRADIFLVMLPVVMDDETARICYYLRDVCIDEENSVILCGNKRSLRIAEDIFDPHISLSCNSDYGGVLIWTWVWTSFRLWMLYASFQETGH